MSDTFLTRQLAHDVHPIPYDVAFTRKNELGKREKVEAAGTATYCLRCGARPGTERMKGHCRSFALTTLPEDDTETEANRASRRRPTPYSANGVPTQQSDHFDERLEKYFGTADYVGGLVSRIGRDLEGWTPGGGTMNALPPYLRMPPDEVAQLRHTYLALRQLEGPHQRILKDYYEGRVQLGLNQDTDALIRYAHNLFDVLFVGRNNGRSVRVKSPKTFTVKELAERACVSPQYMNRLTEEAGVGTQGPRTSRGKPAKVVSEDELEALAEEFGCRERAA